MLHLQVAAAEEGRSVNEIVSERFNSLKDLTASLSDRRAAHCEPPPSLSARKYPAVLWRRLIASASRLLHFLISFPLLPNRMQEFALCIDIKESAASMAWCQKHDSFHNACSHGACTRGKGSARRRAPAAQGRRRGNCI